MNDLGTRMKNYEHRFRFYLNRRTPTILRLDGRNFSKYTKNFLKPFDMNIIGSMQMTAKYLCENVDGCRLGYVQSDEISLLLIDYEKHGTQGWFDFNLQKMCSIAAGMATSYFNLFMQEKIENRRFPHFDCRALQIADPDEVGNYVHWRVQDWNRNSISMMAQSKFSHKQLQHKNTSEMHEMLHQIGINWANQPDVIKNGTFYVKNESGWDQITNQWDYPSWIREKTEYSNYE